MFQPIPEAEWRICHHAKEDCEYITRQAIHLVERLKSCFSEGAPKEVGIKFLSKEGATDVVVLSPFGEARMRLEFRVSGEEVTGVFLVERQRRKSDDGVFWELVWAIGVDGQHSGRQGCSYGANIKHQFRLHGPDSGMPVFTSGMSIMYAIGRGPEQGTP